MRRSMKHALRVVVVVALVVAFMPTLPALADGPIPVWRFYNTKVGSHFYTKSAEEVASVQAKYPDIFIYEGLSYYAWDNAGIEPGTPGTGPLYRFYNKKNGSHFYTISAVEKAKVEATWPTIYAYEGVAYDVIVSPELFPGPPSPPVYRFFNKVNGSHFYTVSDYEKTLVQMLYPDIYKFEGIAFYASPFGAPF